MIDRRLSGGALGAPMNPEKCSLKRKQGIFRMTRPRTERIFLGGIALVMAMAVSSCLIYRPARSYAGIPLKDVISNSGEPNQITTLADGRTLARYDWADAAASPALQRNCMVRFIVDTKGVIESQEMSGTDCSELRTKLRL